MSVQVSYKKQFLFVIISLIIVLIIIEGFANLWLFEINKCDFEKSKLFDEMDPQIKRDLCQQFYNIQFGNSEVSIQTQLGGLTGIESGRIYINNEGFRGPEFSQHKEKDVFRIFLIGGSTIFSAGVPDSQTVSAYMQEYFDQQNLDFKVEVINAGVGGSFSEIETKLIKERLINYNPDLFIIYDGWNDLEHIRSPNFFSIPTKKIISTFEDQNVTGESNPEIWKNRWIEICQMGEKNNFETIITLQPIAGTGKRVLTEHENQYYLDHRSEDLLKPYPKFAQQLPELKKYCSQVIDLRELFDNISEPVYYDEGHVGSLGNSVVANKFYDLALPMIMKESKSTNKNYENSNQTEEITSINVREQIVQNDYSGLDFRINQFLSYHDSPQKLFDFFLNYYKTPSAVSSLILEIQKNNLNKFNSKQTDQLIFNEKNTNSREFINKNFTNIVFKTDLVNSNFINVNLINAKFIESNFNFIKVTDSDLSNISIIRSNLQNSNINNSKINDSTIAYVDWSNSNFSNTSFKNSKFLNVNFNNSTFKSIDFSFADLSNQKLNQLIFQNTNFQNTYFNNADLSNADLKGTNLIYANFRNADLSNADLSNQKLTGISLIGANLTNADLSYNDLSGIDFSNSILLNTNFTNSNLKNIILTNAIIDLNYYECFNHNLCK
jgi:uncharacterized protein YjbI with pentapeptide repeats